MLHTRRQSDFGTWYIPGRKPVINYSLALMSKLGEAAKGSTSLPISGVLFGTADDAEIRITAYRPVETAPPGEDNSASPLTEAGEAELNRLVNSYASDPELAGLRPVGWYRSRFDDVIQLNQGDIRIWNGFFPHVSQLTLVLRVDQRNPDEPARAGFFFRPRHGPVRTDSSYRTFAIDPPPESTEDVGRLAAAVERNEPVESSWQKAAAVLVNVSDEADGSGAGGDDAITALHLTGGSADAGSQPSSGPDPGGSPPAADSTGSLEPPSELFTLPDSPRRGFPLVWLATGLAAVLVLTIGIYIARRRAPSAALPVREVGLRFQGPADRLRLVWNARSALVQGAGSGELRIVDAESDQRQLVPSDVLRSGYLAIANRGGLVEARLRLVPREGLQSPVTVVAQFVGPPGGEARMQQILNDASLAEVQSESRTLRASIQAAIDRNADLSARIAMVRKALIARKIEIKGGQPVPPPATTAQQPVSGSGAAPATASPAAPTPAPLAPPQAQQPPPQAASAPASPAGSPVAAVTAPGPSFGADRIPTRATQSSEPAPPPAYSGPASGKLIWTGFLPAGATVTIDGRRASSGSLNGALPGVPVRLAVYPAEFSAGGLSIYSAAARHQSGTVTEARSAQNGWLAVRYIYDPARARDAQLASPPNQAGGFKQMQIRGGERPVSVVVIEWAVAQ